jgi:hypothetical protein
MPDLTEIYNAFDADEPLPATDDARYVDLSPVRGDSRIAQRLAQKIKFAKKAGESHHLLMGHTKCGKTTELNRTALLLENENYVTVFFDIADMATRTFEYTTVLLLLAGQVVEQLSSKYGIKVKGESTEKLAAFLREKEITTGTEFSVEATGATEVEVGAGWLAKVLGKLGIELKGGFQKSREMTVKIEKDTDGFINAVRELVKDAKEKIHEAGHEGLVIICDGCDKLAFNATDEQGRNYDLQHSLFVDHESDLRAVPCHVIYTVPLSIAVNFGDIWEQTTEFVPAIPVTKLLGIDEKYSEAGRQSLKEVVNSRLKQYDTSIAQLFESTALVERLIDVSGGHISDLLLLIREAVTETQIEGAVKIQETHIKRSIRNRAREYTSLIEGPYLETLIAVDQFKVPPSNSNIYREIISKRLVLEYICGDDRPVDLHPLVAASDAYRRFSNPKLT